MRLKEQKYGDSILLKYFRFCDTNSNIHSIFLKILYFILLYLHYIKNFVNLYYVFIMYEVETENLLIYFNRIH